MNSSIREFLTQDSFGIFLLVTVGMGGLAALLAGRALAATWRPAWQLVLYTVPLSIAVRFLHFALFNAKFLTLYYFMVDYLVCLGLGGLGFRLMRVSQMVSRYKWINERAGWLRWRQRDPAVADIGESG